jgi:hypothetical protein
MFAVIIYKCNYRETGKMGANYQLNNYGAQSQKFPRKATLCREFPYSAPSVAKYIRIDIKLYISLVILLVI